MKKVVPLHDDLFNFIYEALPDYEKVGQRRILLGCWGSFQDPSVCDYTYQNMNEWGNATQTSSMEPDNDSASTEERLRRQIHVGDVAALVSRG